jgi:hypothetical protein
MGKPEIKRQLGRHKNRWEGNIKIDVRNIGWILKWMFGIKDGVIWTGLIWLRIGTREGIF